MRDETKDGRASRSRVGPADGGSVVREVAVGAAYGAAQAGDPEFGALTRRTLDELRAVVLDLDAQRDEIRRLRGETREILDGLAA